MKTNDNTSAPSPQALTDAYDNGMRANDLDKGAIANPYDVRCEQELYAAWEQGRQDAHRWR